MAYRHIRTDRLISNEDYRVLPSYEKEDFTYVSETAASGSQGSSQSSFVTSTVIGAVTGSALLGGLLGGDITGGILGDMLDGDLMD